MDGEPLLAIYKLCDQYVSLGTDKCLVLSKSYYSDLFGWLLCCQRSSMIDWDEFNFIYLLYWCRSQPAGSVCCGSNRQIHTHYRNPVEKKGRHGHSLSERGRQGQREPKRARPLPEQAFIAFLGTLNWGWSSFTMHRFTVGDYPLQTTKDRMLLITSKRRMLQLKGESGWTGYTPYLGGLAQT